MIRIGKIVAAQGLQGALVMTHVAGNSKWLKVNDPLFLELNKESYIPFFVTLCKPGNSGEYVVQFEEVDVVEEARKLIGKAVYVQEDIVAQYIEDSPLLWIGFKITDKEKGEIGVVDDVVQTGAQWLGVLHIHGAEVLVPLVPQTIVQVNLRTKKIHMILPKGLVEIYTNK